MDDPLYDPTAVHSVTRDINDSYPYPTPHVPDLKYLGVHVDETNTGTILPVAPAPTPGHVTPPVSPTPGHGTSGTATPVAPTPSRGTGSTTTPVTPGSSSGTGSTGTTPAAPSPATPTPGSAVTPATPSPTTGTGSSTTSPVTPSSGTTHTPSQGQGGSGTPVAPTIGTTVPVTPGTATPTPTPGASTPTPIVAPPSVPVTPTPTPVNGLSANGAIDLFTKLNKIISDKLAGHTIATTAFDGITPEYTTTASDQVSKHDFNSALAALSTTLANIHGGTAPSITVTEDANPVDHVIVDNLIVTVKTMVS